MTPEFVLTVPNVAVRGRWRQRIVDGSGSLVVESTSVVARLGDPAADVVVPFAALTGTGLRSSVLSLHAGDDVIEVQAGASLDRAWAEITRRACAVPEVTRGLRVLGSSRGGDGVGQWRFFGPLLQARRRLEESEPVDWLVARFDPEALRERLQGVIDAMAAERHPDSPPYRRALEAELSDAVEPLFATLALLGDASSNVRSAGDAGRITAWRAWSAQLRVVFAEADRSWGRIVAVMSRAE